MKRVTDWRARLSAVHEERRRAPHQYGEHDCGLFAADCILAMTGVDLAASFRGRYRDAAGAERLLAAAGYADLCDLAAAYLEEIPPAMARMGDIMAFPGEVAGACLGVVIGERVTVLRPDALGTESRSAAIKAFRVPT